DSTGPDIRLYLNNEHFVFGGITDEHPVLLAKFSDENGINTVGNGIGHDITCILDKNSSKSFVLNNYYESDTDSYQKGTIRYPLESLSEGNHNIKLKAWDTNNNSNEAYTEFVVSKSAKIALNHVLNYPNPFTTHTSFYFEHNRPNTNLDVLIQVFTVSGKLVKTIETNINTDGFRAGPIDWDGLDDFGDKIGRGVYIFRVKLRSNMNETVEKFEKLVILR
ncbi:MAG: T9SS type A sorting domain-containing protein, partial [Bacteroidota bacterium]|nr:T9SS type A sorting domain-containing protein [Bacteroidota bacterium]